MKAYNKQLSNPYSLRVCSSLEEKQGYFLADFSRDHNSNVHFVWEKKGKAVGSISFRFSDDMHAVSLPEAPFGGFFFYEKISSSSIDSFIKAVSKELVCQGMKSVTISQAPKPYELQADLINYLLFKNDFVQHGLLSHHFFIGKKKIKKLSRNEAVRLQAKSKGCDWRVSHAPISNFSFLSNIRSWNQQKGYDVTIDENRLVQQVSQFPERYYLISLRNKSEVLGYSLGVQLTPGSFYYFLSALNPNVTIKNGGEIMLIQLFNLGAEKKVDFIDLGSSDLGREANHNLMFFKTRFSNDISNKVTWARQLINE